MNNHKPAKTAEDIIYDEVDDYNRNSFIKAAENVLTKAQSLNNSFLERQLEDYQESFRTYYYTSQILTDNKNNEFFEQALKEIHPSVKIKTPAKNILRLVSKVYLQQLAQTCFYILQKTTKEDIDQQLVEDAARLLQRSRAKRAKFGKLFSQLH